MSAGERTIVDARWMRAARSAGVPLASVILAMVIAALVILMTGGRPGPALLALFNGAFGGPRQIGETILRSTPLILTGLAVSFGFKAGLFNIGAEGQLFLGGLAAAWIGLSLGGLPWFVSVPILILSSAVFGAAWAFIPALLKARVGAHEVITTMMFGYIGRYLVSWIVDGPLRAPGEIPQTSVLPESVWLQPLHVVFPFLQPSRAHVGFLVALVIALLVWLVFKYTTLGYEVRAVGLNGPASENAGISVSWTTIRALCISGAIAGVAGGVEVLGVHHRLFDQFSSGFGFTGIAVALLAKNNPLAIVPAAILFGALSAGAGTMQLEAGVSQQLVSIVQALVIFFVAAETLITWFIKRWQKRAIERKEVFAGAE